MAFTTQRGRPRKPILQHDFGTPELRLKHALRYTAEPIDLCLERKFLTDEQHWCGLHLRWLYTLRYGAPTLTGFYTDCGAPASPVKDDPAWRSKREQEYHEAVALLKAEHRYHCVMRLAVFNEYPSFLLYDLQRKAKQSYAMAKELARSQRELCEGLDMLTKLWRC